MLGKLLWLTRFGGLLLILILSPLWLAWSGWASWELSRAKSSLVESGIPGCIEEITRTEVSEEDNASFPLLSADKALKTMEKRSVSPLSLNSHKNSRNLSSKDFAIMESEFSSTELGAIMADAITASSRSSYRPERNYREGPSMNLGPAPVALQVAKLLSLRAIVSARAHRQEKSVEDILAISRLARLMRSDDLVISVLVGISADAISVLAAQLSIEALGDVPFSPSTWSDLGKSWEENESISSSSMASALAIETCTSGWFIFERGPDLPEKSLALDLSETPPGTNKETRHPLTNDPRVRKPTAPPSQATYRGLLRPLLNLDHAVYLRSMVEIHRKIKERELEEATRLPPPEIPRWAIWSNLLVPGMESLFLRVITDEVSLKLGRIGLALELYRSEKGAYPPTLSELNLPSHMTRDPFSDRELIYKPEGKGVLLYSLGTNRSDEGGLSTGHPKDGDMVWRIRRE